MGSFLLFFLAEIDLLLDGILGKNNLLFGLFFLFFLTIFG